MKRSFYAYLVAAVFVSVALSACSAGNLVNDVSGPSAVGSQAASVPFEVSGPLAAREITRFRDDGRSCPSDLRPSVLVTYDESSGSIKVEWQADFPLSRHIFMQVSKRSDLDTQVQVGAPVGRPTEDGSYQFLRIGSPGDRFTVTIWWELEKCAGGKSLPTVREVSHGAPPAAPACLSKSHVSYAPPCVTESPRRRRHGRPA